MLLSPEILDDIPSAELSMPSLELSASAKDIFADRQRKAWHADNAEEARCDLSKRVQLKPKSGIWFVSLWKRTVKGRRLSEIKADDAMIDFFAAEIADFLRSFFGRNIAASGFAVVTTPARRHTERNFGELTAAKIAVSLGLPFFRRCAVARSRQRVEAVFEPGNIPPQANIIVFDDIVTTGSTFIAMDALLKSFGKNCFYIAGISNQL